MKIVLFNLAHGRAGDKGDVCNVGIIARRPEYYAILVRELTAERVRAWFGELCRGEVTRYEMPNLEAMNFVLTRALDGGAIASLRLDSQGKSYAFALLRMSIDVPDDLAFERLA